MKLHQRRELIKGLIDRGSMSREQGEKIVAFDRPDDAGLEVSNGEIRLYDSIDSWGGWFGISATEVVSALDSMGDIEDLTVRINSPGGDVAEGIAIYNVLVDHPARVTMLIDGAAYSAASFIAMAGDTIKANRGAEFMIHDAWALWAGDAADMRSFADRLDNRSAAIAEIYAARAGGTPAKWRERMVTETWAEAAEAVKLGLADEMVPYKSKPDSKASNDSPMWNADDFRTPPKDTADKADADVISKSDPLAPNASAAEAADDAEWQEGSQMIASARLQLARLALSD